MRKLQQKLPGLRFHEARRTQHTTGQVIGNAMSLSVHRKRRGGMSVLGTPGRLRDYWFDCTDRDVEPDALSRTPYHLKAIKTALRKARCWQMRNEWLLAGEPIGAKLTVSRRLQGSPEEPT